MSKEQDFRDMEKLEKQCGVEIISYGYGCDEYRYEIMDEKRYSAAENRDAVKRLDRLCETAQRGFIEYIDAKRTKQPKSFLSHIFDDLKDGKIGEEIS